MTDGLLHLYKDELRLLRQDGASFAAAHPDVASHLGIDQEGVSEDPHVLRLLEGFAYLSARIRRKIDDEFPEITEALLGVLHPHLLAPVPSASVVQFTLAPDAAGPHIVKRESVIDTDPIEGHACTFRTTAAAHLWPIGVESASVGPIEETIPGFAIPPDAKCRLKIRLRAVSKDAPFSALAAHQKIPLRSLRFHLHGSSEANLLYEFLLNNVCEGGIALHVPGADAASRLPDDGIRAAGFSRDEAMLPHDARIFPGYRLLMEYFAFPQKFLFIDIAGFNTESLADATDTVDLVIFFDRTSTELERGVGERTLRLGCVPIVNLFAKNADDENFTNHDIAYRVVVDQRKERATEVYSIDRVEIVRHGRPTRYAPLYGLTHAGRRNEAGRYWHAARRPSGDHEDAGTEVDLALADLNDEERSFAAAAGNGAASGAILRVRVTALNRDWTSKLNLGVGDSRLHLHQRGPVARIEAIVKQTETLRPAQREPRHWRLISHLSLNHLTITGGEDGARALRELLALYDFKRDAKSRARIDSIRSIRSIRAPFRVDRSGSFCRGVQIELELDEKRFADNGAFLFASVLDRFLAMSCTINSASRLVVKTSDRTWNRWPARAGERALL